MPFSSSKLSGVEVVRGVVAPHSRRWVLLGGKDKDLIERWADTECVTVDSTTVYGWVIVSDLFLPHFNGV